MSLKCKIGFHTWKGCKCNDCGKIRDVQHDWSKDCEKCSKCGKIESHHDWSKDCEKCSKCGKIESHHDWSKDCEKCSKCSATREKQHDWTQDCEKCCKCGKVIIVKTFTDTRDSNVYKIHRVDNLLIMGENFAFKPPTGNYVASAAITKAQMTYGHLVDSEIKNSGGYFYDWETANNIAPLGWHLPTRREFEILKREIKNGNYANSGILLGGYAEWEGIRVTHTYMNKRAILWGAQENKETLCFDILSGLGIEIHNERPMRGCNVRYIRD
jgi:uncharacterized protein (TIGR02145 family)